MKAKLLILSIVMSLVFCTSSMAGQKTLKFSWNQEISDDFAGWKLYKSEASMIDCKTDGIMCLEIPYVEGMTEYTTDFQLTSPDGQTKIWYFRVTAFDTSMNESGCSNEVSLEIDFLPPGDPISLTVIIIAEQ